MKKNDFVELNVFDMTNEGLGVAQLDAISNDICSDKQDLIFFVKNAILGDKVKAIITKVTSNVIYAKMLSVVEFSPYRVKAKCPVCKQCGGCTIQEIKYEKQIEVKEKLVKRNFNKIANLPEEIIDSKFDGIVSMENPWNYRNKMQIPFSENKFGKMQYGFYVGRTHDIVHFTNCEICFEEGSRIIELIKSWCEEENISAYNEKKKTGLLRHVILRKAYRTNEIGICFVINDNTYPKSLISKCFRLIEELKSYNIKSFSLNLNTNRNNVILGDKTINVYGEGYITDKLIVNVDKNNFNKELNFRISPNSFFQVNPLQAEKLYSIVLEYAWDDFSKNEKALDLFCGIGTMTLFLSQIYGSCDGIEVVDSAIENAKENSRINGVSNVSFIKKDLYKEDCRIEKKYHLVIVDPPRKGLDDVSIQTILKVNPNKLIYVSCDPATLSRDLKKLVCEGYNIEKYKLIDMFPHTMHVECVVLLSR